MNQVFGRWMRTRVEMASVESGTNLQLCDLGHLLICINNSQVPGFTSGRPTTNAHVRFAYD